MDKTDLKGLNVFWFSSQLEDSRQAEREEGCYGFVNTWLRHLGDAQLQSTSMTPELMNLNKFIEVIPQLPVTELYWSEGRDDGSQVQVDGQDRYHTRSRARILKTWSTANSTVLAFDAASAVDSQSPSQLVDSNTAAVVKPRDKSRRPDFGLVLHWTPHLPSKAYRFTGKPLNPAFQPYSRILLLVEVKAVSLNTTFEPTLQYLEYVFEEEMRKQVYEQVRNAFAEYRQQTVILHMSNIEDRCKLRWFHREALEKNRLLEKVNNDYRPAWKDLTMAVSPKSPKMLRLVNIGSRDFNPVIKRELTKSHQWQLASMQLEHASRGKAQADGGGRT